MEYQYKNKDGYDSWTKAPEDIQKSINSTIKLVSKIEINEVDKLEFDNVGLRIEENPLVL